MEALCRRDANLISADATLIFTLKKLKEQGTRLSSELFEALSRRINERRTDVSGVLQFLHANNESALSDSDLDTSLAEEVADIFKVPSKSKIETIIRDIVVRLNGTNVLYPHVRNAINAAVTSIGNQLRYIFSGRGTGSVEGVSVKYEDETEEKQDRSAV